MHFFRFLRDAPYFARWAQYGLLAPYWLCQYGLLKPYFAHAQYGLLAVLCAHFVARIRLAWQLRQPFPELCSLGSLDRLSGYGYQSHPALYEKCNLPAEAQILFTCAPLSHR